MALDEAEALFIRRAEQLSAALAQTLVGLYETPGGFKCEVVRRNECELYFREPGLLDRQLVPYGKLRFRTPGFSDVLYSFSVEGDAINTLTIKTATGEFPLRRC
jgi:hypothetical protein